MFFQNCYLAVSLKFLNLAKPATITGVKLFVSTAPTSSFENNYNGFELFSLASNGNCTFIDTTTRDTAVFDNDVY